MASFEKPKASGTTSAVTSSSSASSSSSPLVASAAESNSSAAALLEFYKDVSKLPQTRLIVRSKDSLQRLDGPVVSSTMAADGAPDTFNVSFVEDKSFEGGVPTTDPSLQVRYESMTVYSPSGDLFVKNYSLVSQDRRVVSRHSTLCRASDGKILANVPVEDLDDARFSSTGSLLVTWSRFKSGNHRFQVWRIQRTVASSAAISSLLRMIEAVTLDEICSFPRKLFAPDIVQFSSDDSYIFVQLTNEIQLYRTADLIAAVHNNSSNTSTGGDAAAATSSAPSPKQVIRVRQENLASFKVSPAVRSETVKGNVCTSVSVAIFVPEIKGNIASTTIHKVTLSSTNSECSSQVVNTRCMFNATECKFMWSNTGNSLVFQASTDMDKSGSSYYGASALYMMANAESAGTSPLSIQVPLTKTGPIHDAKWSPCDDKFIVIAGSMPPQCTMYNDKAQPAYEFGSLNRNTISFSPHGRFVVLAGFGNLAGEMDFYDITAKRIKKIGTNTSHCTVLCMWSPDSRNFVTAAVAPRMNVDNEFKVFKYNGTLIQRKAYPDLILEVRWEHLPKEAYPDRGASPKRAGITDISAASSVTKLAAGGGSAAKAVEASSSSKPVGAYRPPGSSGSLDWTKRDSGPTGKVPSAEKYKPPARTVPGLAVVCSSGNSSNSNSSSSSSGSCSSKQPGKEAVADAPVVSKAILAAMGKSTSTVSTPSAKEKEKEKPREAHPVPSAAVPEVLTAEEKEKRLRNLKKKLKQLQDLKSLDKKTLNPDQISKLATESSLLDDISKLEA